MDSRLFTSFMLKRFLPYSILIIIALTFSVITHTTPWLDGVFTQIPSGLYLVLGLVFAVGYGLNAIAPKTAIPSFVWAIFFGMALQPMLILLTHETESLRIVVELLAALVLFGGGVEIPFRNFKHYISVIASLALLGTVLTAFLFAFGLELISNMMGVMIPSTTFVLIGAILASTDPTAIIPSLKALKFKKPFLRDIAVSESAVNDVIGTILTRFFLVIVLSVAGSSTVLTLFKPFLARATLDSLALEVLWGVMVGLIGAWVLHAWARRSEATHSNLADPALFFAIPVVTFALGSVVGGSGFLAAFVSGLVFEASKAPQAVRQFFETFVDKFIKPIIFILLGAIVPIDVLISTAGLGIVSALVFMFIVRPLVVFITLLPWSFRKKALFGWREIVFLSFIRETGAIPAVLILVAVSSGIAGSDYIFAIGMWVILLTLLIEPPLTPKLAQKLGIAQPQVAVS